MNTQYRKNLKDVATACKNYTDKRFEDFKWELGTHTIDTATDSDVAYQKQAPNGTIGCQIDKLGGMSYKSEGFDGIRDSAVTSIVANSTLNIPASIQALAGYGWGINDTCYNYIDFENKKFVQKVGRVDLGSLTWNYTTLGSSNVFTASISNFKSAGYSVLPNILCSLYQVITRQQMEGGNVDFSVCVSGGTPQPLITNSNYSDATTFKTAMSGVYLYYELATPVETDISSYITDNDKFLEVEALGTITFTNTYEQEVPSEITYLTEVAE